MDFLRSIGGLLVAAAWLGVWLGVWVGGCAGSGSYYGSWKAKNPEWVSTLPDTQAGLHETLAGLQAPTRFEHRLLVSKLAVLVVTEDGARELSGQEIAARLDAAPGDEDLAIIAYLSCRSKIDMQMYSGSALEWVLLEGGRPSAWDLRHFGSRCVFYDEFRPATRHSAALEQQLLRYRDANFQEPPSNPASYYGKGLAYAREGRLAAAEEMLAAGDRSFSGRDPGGVRFARPSDKVQLTDASDDAALRAQLVMAIDGMKGLAPPKDW